jgi:Na+/H+ antiporter NhaA
VGSAIYGATARDWRKRLGALTLSKTVEQWINDGFGGDFFLLIALEIKREAVQGALAGVRNAIGPINLRPPRPSSGQAAGC